MFDSMMRPQTGADHYGTIGHGKYPIRKESWLQNYKLTGPNSVQEIGHDESFVEEQPILKQLTRVKAWSLRD